MKLNPYISFKDDARQALEFYQSVLGGDAHSNTFGEYGDPDAPGADLLMHGTLETEAGFTIMLADTPPGMQHNPGDNVSISLSGEDAETLKGYFEGLSDGGVVAVPLEKQMWGDVFGMFTDKFGIHWMVNIAGDGTGEAAGA
jgi:PhnB protein